MAAAPGSGYCRSRVVLVARAAMRDVSGGEHTSVLGGCCSCRREESVSSVAEMETREAEKRERKEPEPDDESESRTRPARALGDGPRRSRRRCRHSRVRVTRTVLRFGSLVRTRLSESVRARSMRWCTAAFAYLLCSPSALAHYTGAPPYRAPLYGEAVYVYRARPRSTA